MLVLDELIRRSVEVRNRLEKLRGLFDIVRKEKEIVELDKEISKRGLWDDTETARRILKRRSILQNAVDLWNGLNRRVEDIVSLIGFAKEEEDSTLLSDMEKEIEDIKDAVYKFEIKLILSDEHDINNAILSIRPGAGGIDSQDWTQMLLRMYLMWAEKKGYKTEIIDLQPGEEGGLKNVTVMISGDYAYGYLKAETGVHRLVRISPFDVNKRRHTSFASVYTSPEIDEEIRLKIDESDLRIDTFRSSGAGGQHVNVTDSAIRITHIPTGIVVQCQNDRSQHRNKATAMKILRSRLYEFEMQRQREKKEESESLKKDITWGNQIRSYVLHPYKMIKDIRTKVEVSNVEGVLDGDIDQFIETYLIKNKISL
ncbi:MAG: peptide chain release factor 2 [Nitrospinae bacterium]|nr:peptide chain release factor 2 [Nitrospinota bacterium]